MTYNPTRCPGINNLTAKIAADPKYVEHIAKITTPLAKELTNVFGLPVPPTGWTSGIATKLYVLEAPCGLGYPRWTCVTSVCAWCAQRLFDDAPLSQFLASCWSDAGTVRRGY